MLTQAQINFLKKHIKGLSLHWSVGSWSQVHKDYHFNITYDGKLAHVKQTLSLYEVGAHTWHRNTGLIGISFCGMAKGYPIEEHQVEVMAKLCAELCFILDLDPNGTYKAKDLKKPGVIHDVRIVADHKTYALIDYPGQKWDIGHEGDPVVLYPLVYKKVQWYYSKLKNGQHKVEFCTNLK